MGHGETYLANQQRIAGDTRPQAHQPGTGAVREGSAQLQGLASCGICGRRLAVSCDGPAKSTPATFAPGQVPARSAHAEHDTCASAVRRSTRP
jgi:hypothetical protein